MFRISLDAVSISVDRGRRSTGESRRSGGGQGEATKKGFSDSARFLNHKIQIHN